MSVTPAQLRSDFPEFANTTTYPDSLVNSWVSVAVLLVNPSRWNDLTTLGIELITAHHLALSAKDQAASTAGVAPGTSSGPLSSKSVDKVSASYDTGSVALTDAGFWGLTSYGLRFLTLARAMGAGGYQTVN